MAEYDLYYVPLKAVKGQAVADFLAAHPVPTDSPLMDLDEDVSESFEVEMSFWRLYFDGAATREKSGAGTILITPQGDVIPYSFALERICTNNMAEYEALVIGLKLALGVKAYNLLVFGDLELVIRQVTGQYEVREDHLASYCRQAHALIEQFENISFHHIPRSGNAQADALSKLASTLAVPEPGILNLMVID